MKPTSQSNRSRIGLIGLRGSGKTTAANLLRELDYTRLSFASPLKAMCSELVAPMSYQGDARLEYLFGSKKEEVIPHLGVTGRHLMQTLGTEWGRNMIHSDIWINILLNNPIFQSWEKVVVDDVRFLYEAKALRDNGAKLIRITRPGIECGSHSSEQESQEIEADFEIINSGDLVTLSAHLKIAIETLT